jgi:GGDEF domain-containing protein
LFDRVCTAIAECPAPVTASIGTAYTALDTFTRASAKLSVNQLVAAADNAMYLAKRGGGNRCHDHGPWPSPAIAS